MPENILSKKIKKLRKEKKITQNKLSEKLGFSERYISRIESGVKPSMEALKKIADFFEIPIEYLISEDEDPNTLGAIIKNREVLEAFVEVDQMREEQQKIILAVIESFSKNNRMKDFLEGKK